jgi:RNA polymerase sigma factor (sigma-70 family)
MPDRVLQSLVHAVRHSAAADAGDAELLQRYVASRDAAAFELLVWRHGAMVEAVCRRVLGNSPEVDDAFQATFLALLKQARSIRTQTSVAGWLHRVALRIAKRARHSAARRRSREEASAKPDLLHGAASDPDFGPLLHEEIDRLPPRFRLPLVLCHLQGRSVEEAARLLGVPRGTVLSRLARGRDRLRLSLLRRGVVPAVAAVALAESESTVSAALVAAAVRTINHGPAGPVAGLAHGVIRDMMLTKIKMTACLVLAIGAIGLGTALVSQPTAAAMPDDKPGLIDRLGTPEKKPAGDLDRMQGTWQLTSIQIYGVQKKSEVGALEIKGDRMILKKRGDEKFSEMRIKLSPASAPPAIDMIDGTETMPGIYQIKGDTLRLCVRERGDERPTEFRSADHVVLMELSRPGKQPPKAEGPKSENLARALQDQIVAMQQQLAAERDRLAVVQKQLEAERDRSKKIELELKKMTVQAQQAAADAESQRKVADLLRAEAQDALKRAQDALELFRKSTEKSKPAKP